MKYSEFKKVCQPGDLIAVSHQEWKTVADIESQIVRMMTESEYSHVCVLLESGGDTPTILEAVVPAVKVNPIDRYLENGFYWIHMPDKPMTDAEREYGLSKVGQEYSKGEAIAGYLKLLDIGSDQKWQCSELTISMRKFSGISLGPVATPAAVVHAALSRGYTLTLVEKD